MQVERRSGTLGHEEDKDCRKQDHKRSVAEDLDHLTQEPSQGMIFAGRRFVQPLACAERSERRERRECRHDGGADPAERDVGLVIVDLRSGKEDEVAKNERSECCKDAVEGSPSDDAGAVGIVVGEFGAERGIGHDESREADTQDERDRRRVEEERNGVQAARQREEKPEADEDQGQTEDHVRVSAAPKRRRIIRDRAHQGIDEGIRHQSQAEREAGENAG